MRPTFKSVDFGKTGYYYPCVTWMGLIQSVEGLNKDRLPPKGKEFCQQPAFRFELQHQLLPESCWSTALALDLFVCLFGDLPKCLYVLGLTFIMV